MQIDVDLWIFEKHYIVTQKLKGSGHKTFWICGVWYGDLWHAITLVAQNAVDLWIFEYLKIMIQKVKVTVCKTLWICGFSSWTYLRLVLGYKHWNCKFIWICGFLKIITLYIKNSKWRKTLWICGVLYGDLWGAITLVAQNDVDLWIFEY